MASQLTSYTAGPTMVWSNRSTTSELIFPITPALPAATIQSVRSSLELRSATSKVSVQIGYQYSDDQETWYDGEATPTQDEASTLGSARTSDGVDYGSTFTDITTSAKLFVRFVLVAKNDSEGDLEMGTAAARLDLHSEA